MSKAARVAIAAFAGWFLFVQFGGRRFVRMDPADVQAIITRLNAEEFGGWFRVADVMAVVAVESDFRPAATRWEAALDEASIGLGQVLYSTALDRMPELRGNVAALYDPTTNLRVTMRQLRWSWDYLRARDPNSDFAVWIGSYNAGVGNASKGNWSRAYVNRWVVAREEFA